MVDNYEVTAEFEDQSLANSLEKQIDEVLSDSRWSSRDVAELGRMIYPEPKN